MRVVAYIKKLISKISHCYDYGKNNKVIFTKNGEVVRRFSLPKGLTILLEGSNNIVRIDESIRFDDVLIDLEGDGGVFSIKKTRYKVRNARFYIEDNSAIYIGENCQLKSGNLKMIANCYYGRTAKIKLGNEVFLGQNATIRTSDGHTLIDAETKAPLNPTEDVIIDDHVWVTSNCTILKGSHIPEGSVVGACSLVNTSFNEKNVIIAGSPAKIIRRGVTWDPRGYGVYTRKYKKNI
jgi:acetyltransferase-like isoleucine patch superfamily enzyme